MAFGSVFSNCSQCNPTTTTSTTTTTTTIAPTFYLVERCGGGDGPYVITRGSGDIPAGTGQAFKLSGGGYSGFNGSNCWVILDDAYFGPADFTNVGFGSVFSSCEVC